MIGRRQQSDNLLGKQLGDYKLLERLATGGMARIYIGEDVKLGRRAAVKVLTQGMMELDPTLTERFQREAKAVAALDHPNIVPIYQYGEADDLYFLAMKLIEGEDFADELNRLNSRKKLIAPTRLVEVMEQVADALDYAHSHGIIHRDIKPSNILLDQKGRAYLTDFGLVLRLHIDKTTGTAFGTPRYISPEQALASEKSVPQSDIYSLAVIFYEALTGSMVFKAETAMQIALSHISEEPPPLRVINPDIPRSVEYEVLKALRKEPQERHSTAASFVAAVKQAYGDQFTDKQAVSPEVLHSKTPPLRPADMDKIVAEHLSESSKRVIPAPLSQPDSGSKKRRSPVFTFFSVLMIAAVSLAAGLMLGDDNSSASNGTPQPTSQSTGSVVSNLIDTTPEATPEVIIEGGTTRATLYYNTFAFALRNDSKDPIDLSRVSFVRSDGIGMLQQSDMSTLRLEQSNCLFVTSDREQDVQIDPDWKCDPASAEPHRRPTTSLFWRLLNDEVNSFNVLVDGVITTTCPAIIGGRESICTVELPLLAESD